jgi:lipopolysaccharide transport system permease protein
VVTITPPVRGARLDLASLWEYRELLYFLTWRDVKVRYKQTVLGAAWAILQPLMAMIVFTLFFGRLAGVPSDGLPYAPFAFAGLLPWTFFSNAVTSSSNSLVGSSSLITKVYFPRMIIPGAAVLGGLVDFAVGSVILIVLMAAYGLTPGFGVLLLPVLVLLLALLALGVGLWVAALNVRYRDVRYALPFLIQLWMFASPIIYPASFVPEKYRWLLLLNPLTGLIEGQRAALFGRPMPWLALAVSLVVTLTVLVFSAFAFRRMERDFADLL